MLQTQDIKGFTLLELLVVVALISIISAIGIPNFSGWKKDREVRVASEKIAAVLSGVNAQTKRGSYPYVQMFINSNTTIVGPTGSYPATIIMGRGMTKTNLATDLNSGKFPNCSPASGSWENPTFSFELKNIYLHFTGINGICFSADETYYAMKGNLAGNKNISLDQGITDSYIIVCSSHDAQSAGKCDTSKPGLKKPAYLIEWSRFGNVRKYKWSGSDWTK
ncbi:prepilin-type N-terminal cleavage/methylation domain-containing protein [Candidatus Pelagibacter sp.]|nr:prepilin-type N-terminal cleavage/methylation domain-containing protein [Candidatus Pelagibacter sp.]